MSWDTALEIEESLSAGRDIAELAVVTVVNALGY